MLAPDLSTLSTMRTEGFATLYYPEQLKAKIAKAVDSWKAFLSLPDERRTRFGYLPDTGNSGSGYEPPDLAKKDFKHVFHTKLKDVGWLFEQAALVDGKDGTEAKQLVSDSLLVIGYLKGFIFQFAKQLEEEFEVGNFAEDFWADANESILRHLFYPPGARAVGEEIAVQHVDKGGFTFHNWESHPGVERLTHDRKWVPFPVGDGEAVVFGSLRLQHRSKNAIKGLCHRVVLVPEAVASGRYATVFFANFRNSPYYDKRRLGPTQNHELGFNYDLSWEEFDKLFAPYE